MENVIAITGSSGFIGNAIISYFTTQGDEIIRINREAIRNKQKLQHIMNDAHGVINLAGASILTRWTDNRKAEIINSRIETTRKIASAIQEAVRPPKLFVSASAIGLYDDRGEHTETSRNIKKDFLAQVVQQWEKEARTIGKGKTRVVIFRLGIVLGRNGGMMKKLIPIFNFGLGAAMGSGKQGFSFIHIDDVIGAINHIMVNEQCEGIYNLVAPSQATNDAFTRLLGEKMHRPVFLRIPERLLRLVFLDGATVLSEGQRVVPERLLSEGFTFQYDTLDKCLENIVKK
jgi:uncharacterized protein (TIGR01777 family)